MARKMIASPADIKRYIDAAVDAIAAGSAGAPVLIGIQTRGVHLARRIAEALEKKTGILPRLGALDINFYRDDLSHASHQPVLRKTDIDFSLDDLDIFLVDDVLYTGRTIRAALDALVDFGRPARVRLFVLVDRGGRELPIQADWRAIAEEVKDPQSVEVCLKECDKDEGIFIV